MNKLSSKKLHLGKETLIALQSQDLADVVGGGWVQDAANWVTKNLCPPRSHQAGMCTADPPTFTKQ
jgi:hypothetical protein